MTQEQFDCLFNKARELMNKTLDPVHDWAHIERVLVNVKRIKELLPEIKVRGLNNKILKLAVAWHDISYTKHKATFIQYIIEVWRSRRIIYKYFNRAEVDKKETDFIYNIIFHHDWTEIFILKWIVLNKRRSIYHQIVQDADTMDCFSGLRIRQAKENINSLFKRVVMGFLKPLFYNFVTEHKGLIYNLPEIIIKLEKENDKY